MCRSNENVQTLSQNVERLNVMKGQYDICKGFYKYLYFKTEMER